MAKQIIQSQNHKDREGNLIGSLDNLQYSYNDLQFQLGMGVGCYTSGKTVDLKTIKDKINTYLGVRHCFDGGTSNIDDNLNNLMKELAEEFPVLTKDIGYKPIEAKTIKAQTE